MNHDIGWYIHVAGRLVDGADLYVDVVEVNPPLIVYLATPAVALARILGAWDVAVYRTMAMGAALLSLTVTWRLLPGLLGPGSDLARRVILLLLAFLVLAGAGIEFGQREHLVVLFAVPYLLAAGARASGAEISPAFAVLVGALGGIGFAIKPHFLLVLVAVEAYVAWRRSPRLLRRPELLAAACVVTAYAGVVVVFEADYLRVARMGLEVYDDYLPADLPTVARMPQAAFAAVAAAVGAWAPGTGRRRPSCRILALSTALFAVAVFIQNKGWSYHWYPAVVTGALTLAVAGLGLLDAAARALRDRLPTGFGPERTLLALLTAILLAGTAWRGMSSSSYRERMAQLGTNMLPEMIRLVEERTDGDTIAILSTSMQVAFPLVNYTGVGWGLRFSCLWMLPGLYEPTPPRTRSFPYHDEAEMGWIERYLRRTVVRDLRASRPRLLIVDTWPPGYTLYGFDYLEYLEGVPGFRSLMEEYRRLGSLERFSIFVRTEKARRSASSHPAPASGRVTRNPETPTFSR